MCRSKPTIPQQRTQQSYHKGKINQLSSEQPEAESESSTDEEYLYVLSLNPSQSPIPRVTVNINKISVDMIVDTIDILDEDTYNKVNHKNTLTLQPSTKHLFAYGSTSQLNVLGCCTTTIAIKTSKKDITFYVIEGGHGSLLSYATARDLGILNIHINQIKDTLTHDLLCTQYPDVFNGIGQLKGVTVKLPIDSTVPPDAQKARRSLFHLRKKVDQELSSLEQQNIIERVEGPTPWVSPLVVIPKKNGDVRICVDMRMPNKAIRRERHPTPTIEDLIQILNGATVFLKLDLRSGYHQLTIAPECRYITTFATHRGLWRYTRLNFGMNSASEIFQKAINEQICNIP